MFTLNRNYSSKPLVALLIAVLLLASAFLGQEAASGFSGPTNNPLFPSGEQVNVLVGFHGSPDKAVVESFGGRVYMELELIDALAATMSSSAAIRLLNHPKVSYIEPDDHVYSLELSGALPDTTVDVQAGALGGIQVVPWGVARVFGEDSYPFNAWEITTGRGVSVAILDTGIYREHEDIEAAGGMNYSQTPQGSLDYDYFDANGHGTHVAGIIGALDNDFGVVGISPGVDLYAVKILDESGLGTVSSVIDGIQWAVKEEIPIINMSLYSSNYSRALNQACQHAYDNGHLLVAAAGNLGKEDGIEESVSYPAAYDSVIAVAASDETDQRAAFSSTGPQVELIAPGKEIWSTWTANSYYMYSGTSMASLHVVGAAALVWSVNPQLSNVLVREMLQQTAENLHLPKNHQGYGLVRADRALAAAASPGPGGDKGAAEVVMEIGSKTAYFDDEPNEMDVAPFIMNSRTFVPVRFLGEAFAAGVDWEPKDARVETVTLKRKDVEMTLTIGSHNINVYQEGAASTVVSDVAAFIQNGRTFLPFRVIAEAFGSRVGHDSCPETGLVTRVWFRQ